MIIPNADQPSSLDEKAPSVPSKDPAGPPSGIEQLPPPPPYSPAAGPSTAPPPPPQRPTSSVLQPQTAQTVNHFEVFSKHNSVSGTYLVDPLLPTPAVRSSLRKIRRKHNKSWGNSCSSPADINASFRTRHGAISLDMAVVADSGRSLPPGSAKVPACVLVSTRHGRINVNLFEIQPNRSIDLQVESRHGRIVLFLPATYEGPVMFQTRSASSVNFLPAFAARARTLRASDRETLVVCTLPDSPDQAPKPVTAQPERESTDRVLVRTRHGRITIGISGLDKVEESSTGGNLFQKLGELIETGGKALGQYVEAQAAVLEKKLTERNAMYGQTVLPKLQERAALGRPGVCGQTLLAKLPDRSALGRS